MLEPIMSTKSRELTLQYILTFKEGYTQEIARYFDLAVPSVKNQLKSLENGGVLLSKQAGRTKIYFANPRYIFLPELSALLLKAKEYYKAELKEKLTMQRMRPRRPGKPL